MPRLFTKEHLKLALIHVQDGDIMMVVMVSIQELTLTAQMFDSFIVQ